MVQRSTVAVSFVVFLVLLSGCSTLLDAGNGTDAGPDTDGPTDPEAFDYPDGYGPEGVIDGEAAVRSHQSALIDRGSYTGTYSYRIEAQDGETFIDVEIRVDFQAEAGFQHADVSSPNRESVVQIYRDSDTRYQRSEVNNETTIGSSNQSFDPPSMTTTEPVRPLLENVSEYESSIGERDGDTVVVYRKTDAEGIDAILDTSNASNIYSFNATFAIDSDGVVRSASYEIDYQRDTGQNQRVNVEYELSAFNETTVDRPAWADEA